MRPGTSCLTAAGFLPDGTALAAGVFLGAGGCFLVPGFVTIVVPALELLASLVLPSKLSAAAPARLVWRLGARFERLAAVGWAENRASRAFSGDSVDGLIGEWGNVRELWDLGDRMPAGPALRDAVRVALELATAPVVLVRFFGFASSDDAFDSMFSLSSPVEISSLVYVSTCAHGSPNQGRTSSFFSKAVFVELALVESCVIAVP